MEALGALEALEALGALEALVALVALVALLREVVVSVGAFLSGFDWRERTVFFTGGT